MFENFMHFGCLQESRRKIASVMSRSLSISNLEIQVVGGMPMLKFAGELGHHTTYVSRLLLISNIAIQEDKGMTMLNLSGEFGHHMA